MTYGQGDSRDVLSRENSVAEHLHTDPRVFPLLLGFLSESESGNVILTTKDRQRGPGVSLTNCHLYVGNAP